MTVRTDSTLFAPLIGRAAQGCWLGYGSKLFLEFGQPQPPKDRQVHPWGEWGLSCDWVEWRIEQGERVLAGSEDDRADMEMGIRQIDGKTLVSGEISQTAGDSVLTFSDDLVLRTFVVASEEDARWNFRDQDGKYFRLGPERAIPEENPAMPDGQQPK
jgi:hypothetical protein